MLRNCIAAGATFIRSIAFERDSRLLLRGADGQRGLDAGDVGRGGELGGQELLEALQVAGDHLFVPLRAEVRRRAFKSAEEACQIVSGRLPGTAGVIGAAAVFKKETYGVV